MGRVGGGPARSQRQHQVARSGGQAGAVGCRAPSSLPPAPPGLSWRRWCSLACTPRGRWGRNSNQSPSAPAAPPGAPTQQLPPLACLPPTGNERAGVQKSPRSPPPPRLCLLGFPPRFLRLCACLSPTIAGEDGNVAPFTLCLPVSPAPKQLPSSAGHWPDHIQGPTERVSCPLSFSLWKMRAFPRVHL